ncbi:hypothetical protein ABT354_24155 [Streptomyces sp. NPDC000594]|uniref:hypothetical protein n=1 Tax=Streptomyces sp. NPDC000594 TaxID=3154261 RepID=UPI0033204AE6
MRKWFQSLSDSMVDRLVPKADASAAVQCWTEEICQQVAGIALCTSTDKWLTATYLVCSDGTRTYQGWRCGRC